MRTVREQLSGLWMEAIGSADIKDEDSLIESGGTSLTAVQLAAEIQEEFGIGVDAIEIIQHTFGGILALVEKRVAG